MQIDETLVSHLEDLSYLTLSDDEKRLLTEDLRKILSGMARLEELATESVPERSHPFDNVNVFREDEAHASCERELILKNAPERDAEMFLAPRTVE
jgi:aspartyl-tRNA(Asn)/glutamyl-tRNA(Gln) amidotransferase subunit C